MRNLLPVLALVTFALLAPAVADADRQRPITVGEHVQLELETPHPYTASGAAAPELTWSDRIVHPGATYVAIHFARFELAPGDYVVVRSPDGRQKWEYRGRGKRDLGMTKDGFFAAHIKGAEAVVELYTAGDGAAFGYRIDLYGRGYNDQEIRDLWDQGLGEILNLPMPQGFDESVCTADDTEEVKCYQATEPAAYANARAVARLLLNGSAHCTGWLVGTEGHLMTNEHCITSQSQTDNIDFEFMAEGATCQTNCASSLACPGVVEASGGTFVTDDAPLDYALVIPDTSTGSGTDLPATYGFFRLRQSGAVLDERIYLVQHPAGWGKRFAMVSSYPDDVTAGGFNYASSLNEDACSGGPGDVGYWADTQGGSSGSPVIGYSDHRIVAIHHCRGTAFCTSGNPGTDDRNRGVPIQDIITDLGPLLPQGAVCDPPTDPLNLVAAAAGDNRIDLTWGASTPPTVAEGGPVTYNVYRAVGSCPQSGYQLIAAGVAGTGYSDLTVSADVTYSYQVRGYLAATECESGASNCDDASTTGNCTQPPVFAGVGSVTNAGSAACAIDVGWAPATGFCTPGVVYNVYRAPAGGPPAPIATCVSGTTYSDSTAVFGVEYDYLVRAEDQSGSGGGTCAGGNEDANAVTLQAVATGPDLEAFADDVEAGGSNFVAASGPNDPAGTTPWGIVTTDSNSPTHSWFVAEQPSVKDEVLTLAAAVPVGAGATLEFWHHFNTEPNFDGGVLEVSTNGGGTWTDIGSGRFLEGGYNSTLSTGFSNPLPGRAAWSGDSGGWVRVQVDLADFGGQNALFRWRFGCDSSVTDVGWWVDDVRVFEGSMCSDPLFTDGFESGNTSAWSAAVD